MQIAEMMEKMALLWPRKFNPEAIPVQTEVYRAALGQAEGERLECAWRLYLEKGMQTYPPSPRELRELLPTGVSAMPDGQRSSWREQRDARMERLRNEAQSWLMEWWAPLIASAVKNNPDLAAALRRTAMVECNARAFPIALAGGTDGAIHADRARCAAAMQRTMERFNIRANRLAETDLPDDAVSMWRALHGGQKPEVREVAA